MGRSTLVSDVIKLGKQKIIPATVVDVLATRCSVRLSNGGKLLKGLTFFGTSPVVGALCHVDYRSGVPVVYTSDADLATSISDAIAAIPPSSSGQTGTPAETTLIAEHNDQLGIQGGTPASDGVAAQHYHLTEEEYTGGIVTEAPIDAFAYAREGGEWKKLEASILPVESDAIITDDATYRYYIFHADGYIKINSLNKSSRVLIVAGGGSGGGGDGSKNGGGGGAGGVLKGDLTLVVDTIYNVTVGDGGVAPGGSTSGNNGGNSTIGDFVAYGGGGGGYFANGKNGGSGGGGGASSGSDKPGGSATQTSQTPLTGHGYAGGAGSQDTRAGGGGGAGSVGVKFTTGGNPIADDITGVSVNYSRGGSVGGGAGTIYTGNGGGGNTGSGQAGGKGIVIIRIPLTYFASENVSSDILFKSIYDTDNDGIVDKSETIDDGAGNTASAADTKDAVTKKHTQGTDVALGAVNTKNLPIDADKVLYRDSVTSDGLVTSTWAQVKTFLKTYFDPLYKGHTIKDEAGAGLTARTNLNFTGTGVAATDNAGTDSTDVTIPGNMLFVDQAGGTGDTYGVLAGLRNGINTQFTVAQAVYITGTLSVYLNGQLLTQGSAEGWVETTPASGIFNFAVAPLATDEITVVYGSGVFSSGGGGGYAEGTSFPVAPSVNDKYYRTDRNLLYFYDGTRWLTTTLYHHQIESQRAITPLSADTRWDTGVWTDDYDQYLINLYSSTYTTPTNDATKYWTVSLISRNGTASSASIASFNTSADTESSWTKHKVAINALLGTTEDVFTLLFTKTSTVGTLYISSMITYRLVG